MELCAYWTGQGCICDYMLTEEEDRPIGVGTCPECGNSEGLIWDMWDGSACTICDWQENPL